MSMRPDEIVAILRRQIQELDAELQVESEGTVLTVGDGIARVYGLEQAMAGEHWVSEDQDGAQSRGR